VCLNSCGETKKGQAITLYLFNDLLEVTKRRNRSVLPRSPATFGPSRGRSGNSKGHKHIDCLSLSAIRKVEDVTGCEEAEGLFLLTIRDNSRGQILEEEQWTLQVTDHTEAEKRAFLSALANEVLRIISSRDVGVLEFAMDDPNTKPERVEALKQAIKLSRTLPKRSTSR
uniref:ECT2 PH domain-containing protein n=1 Tax=Plectus sambesii TaxID=2011161 RepID=A0A914VBL9_9BILA